MKELVLIKTVEKDGTTYGVSLHGSNPSDEEYIECKDEQSAIDLFEKLSKEN